MDILLLEERVRNIEKSIYDLQIEILKLKTSDKHPTLQEVTAEIELDLPKEIDLDQTLQDIRER